jgi:NADPH:quinone reductase-like Zn-dependent oxidoreductase
MLRTLGADDVIDYSVEDFTENGQTYDLIFDVIGKSSLARGLKSLSPNGRFLLSNPRLGPLALGLWTSATSRKKVVFGAESGTNQDLVYLRDLIEAGRLRTVIDRIFPLEAIVDAHRYAESGQKKGNIVVTVSHTDG